jgi:methyl-accepting chemotaxis protein WspA
MNFLTNLKIREKLLLGFGLLGLIFVVSSMYNISQISSAKEASRSIAEQNAPAWDAIMEIKVEVVMGHFWLEKALAGDISINKEMIFNPWDQAKWFAEALLHGGEKEGNKYFPIESTEIRGSLNKVIKDLDVFIGLAEQLYQAKQNEASAVLSGSELDQAFDEQFNHIMDDMSEAEDKVGGLIAEGNAQIQKMFEAEKRAIIIELIIILLLGVIIAIYISQQVVARPLKKIADIVQSIADGDLTKTARVESKDEVGMMAEAINVMSGKLSTLMSRVQQSGIQVASSVTEIAASTKEQEATATEHAATTNQIAASVKEISATSKQLGQTTEDVTQLALGTAATASEGQVMLDNLDTTMNRMAKASGSIADKLADLNEKASNIGNMVTTINKVADQTNLLSLNAAIEAEKAGEYGRGFAVVATEIRRLADQTAVATYDIEQMVSEVQSAISAGVMSMDKFSEEINSSVNEAKKAGAQLEKVIEQTQALAPHFESVNEGLQAQIEGAEQISEAMINLSEAAQQTAEFVRHSNDTIHELNSAAHNMQEGASIFKVNS